MKIRYLTSVLLWRFGQIGLVFDVLAEDASVQSLPPRMLMVLTETEDEARRPFGASLSFTSLPESYLQPAGAVREIGTFDAAVHSGTLLPLAIALNDAFVSDTATSELRHLFTQMANVAAVDGVNIEALRQEILNEQTTN